MRIVFSSYLERWLGRLSWFGRPEPRPGAFTDCDRQWCGEPYLLKNERDREKNIEIEKKQTKMGKKSKNQLKEADEDL